MTLLKSHSVNSIIAVKTSTKGTIRKNTLSAIEGSSLFFLFIIFYLQITLLFAYTNITAEATTKTPTATSI